MEYLPLVVVLCFVGWYIIDTYGLLKAAKRMEQEEKQELMDTKEETEKLQ